ncbi:MAG: glycosyltransferase [Nostoc sp. NOS(2021)]|nr:glycosyltransferase [Nostoc sp. NOS(2021)]
MLFDLATGGHHPSYISHLINYCCEAKLPINLDIVVSPKFIDEHSDVVKISLDRNSSQIRFIPITVEEYSDFISNHSLVKRIFREWNLYCKYARELKAEHCLLMYLDTLQLPIVLGKKSPCKFSGIYFRPTFHYKEFDNYTFSRKDIFRQWRQKLLLSGVLNNPQFQCLFSLDPFAIKHIEKLHSQAKVFHLADPVRIYKSEQYKIEQLRQKIRIDPDKKIFLLFGTLTNRKGIYQLLDAIQLLPSDICEKLCLLLVGSISSTDKISIQSQIKKISQSLPVQIIIRDEFIAEENVHLYFQLADVILAPYQKHVGMSGILLLAAAAQKPVLSSNYGLMGQLVRHNRLGITVDSTSPQAIANGIIDFINDEQHQAIFFDLKMIDEFVEDNLAENFSHTLFKHIYAQINISPNL